MLSVRGCSFPVICRRQGLTAADILLKRLTESPQLSSLYSFGLQSVPSASVVSSLLWGRVLVKTRVTSSFISDFAEPHSLASKNPKVRELRSSKLIIADAQKGLLPSAIPHALRGALSEKDSEFFFHFGLRLKSFWVPRHPASSACLVSHRWQFPTESLRWAFANVSGTMIYSTFGKKNVL